MRKTHLIKVLLATLILLTLSCKKETEAPTETKPAFNLEEAKAAIETAGQTFVIAMNKGDSITLANCYTKDAKMMGANEKSIIGRPAIKKVFSDWIKGEMPTFTMKTIEIWGNEEMMAAEEEWTFSDKDGKILDSGKSIELFKMEDGKWRLYRDCYNSDLPCPSK
ncbi:YybH family protein [Flavobacterium limnophilum]|uniref:YybH family protein n=1 Tax=Flavobacterium limnophilum TaxID=3003262 RepID=UPI002482E964|nr:nuclear transport factor 2 family protein [Flavobacterium limnophilum]